MKNVFKKLFSKASKKTDVIDSIDMAILLKVTNDTKEWQKFELFNAKENHTKENVESLNKNVKIESKNDGYTYKQILYRLIHMPCLISLTYIQSEKDFESNSVVLSLSNRKVFSEEMEEKDLVLTSDPYQKIKSILTLKHSFHLDKYTKLIGDIPPKTTYTFSFYYYKQINLAEGLKDFNPNRYFYGRNTF